MPVRRSRANAARPRASEWTSANQTPMRASMHHTGAMYCNAIHIRTYVRTHARMYAPAPASGWWNGALRGNLTYDILKASRPYVGVCWNVGMSDGFCVGHGILHLAGYGALWWTRQVITRVETTMRGARHSSHPHARARARLYVPCVHQRTRGKGPTRVRTRLLYPAGYRTR